jgi:hypothetical protein
MSLRFAEGSRTAAVVIILAAIGATLALVLLVALL